MGLRSFAGNYLDLLGTGLGLPELGLSERLNRGNSTKYTGYKQPGAADFGRSNTSNSTVGLSLGGLPKAPYGTKTMGNVIPVGNASFSYNVADQPLQGPQYDPYAGLNGAGTGSGSGSGQYTFLGRTYGSQAAMEAAQNAYLDQVYGNQLSSLFDQENRNLSDLGTSFNRSVGYDITGPRRAFGEAGGTVGENRESFIRSIINALSGVDESETTALNQIGSYYSSLGDGYQSSEGYLRGRTADQSRKARENLNEQKVTGLRQLEQNYNDFIDSSLRNRSDIINSATEARNQLAEGFASARGGFIPEDIESLAGGLRGRIASMNNPQLASAPGVTQQQVDNYQRLLDDLIASRSSTGNARAFGSRQSQAAALNPILAYLAGVGA